VDHVIKPWFRAVCGPEVLYSVNSVVIIHSVARIRTDDGRGARVLTGLLGYGSIGHSVFERRKL
jgi:hypothetical protein